MAGGSGSGYETTRHSTSVYVRTYSSRHGVFPPIDKMAQWWEVLSRVDIFRDFLKDGKSEGSGLLTSTESDLLLWVEERKCVLAINLRKLHMQLQNEDVDAVEWPEVFYQLLLCSKEPFYTVHRIQVSPKGESLLLEGISNLMVMKMLKRRGLRGEYGGGHKEVVCA